MKKLKLIFSLLLLNACADQPSHTISGRLEFGGNTTLVLSEITGDGEVPLDSTTTDSHGSFSLRNAATQRDYYLLRTGPQSVIYLILDGSEDVVLTGDARQLDATYTVKGSDESELIRLLRARDRQLTDSLNRTFAGLSFLNPVERDSAAHGLETVYTGVMRSYAADMIRDHPGSLASLSATKFLHQSADAALMRLLADSLSVRYPGNLYVEDYLKLVRDLERLPPGTTAPAIRGKTPEGKEISLSEFKGKLLLVDFWASWCGPCRRANPDLKRLYSQYRSDRFEILGVSLDDDRDSWKQAIRNDGLTWPQLSELRKWDGQCVKDYGIEAIPFSVLVDEDGKILAKGLTAEDLHRVIREHLYKKDKGAQDGRP